MHSTLCQINECVQYRVSLEFGHQILLRSVMFLLSQEFIMNQDWNDAKSQLQQCCLTLRDPSDGDPDIPIYKFEFSHSFLIGRTFITVNLCFSEGCRFQQGLGRYCL